MTRSRQSLSAIAMGIALAVVFAAVALASSAATEPYPNHEPVRGNYPGSYVPDAPIAVASQRHPNHKPVRGNYPGGYVQDASNALAAQRHPSHKPLRAARYRTAADASVPVANHKPLRGDYPDSAAASAAGSSDTFDWADAGIGAAITLGLLLLLTAAKTGGARARQRYAG